MTNDDLKAHARILITSDSPSAVTAAERALADAYTAGCRGCVADALSLYADERDLPEGDLDAHVDALLDELDARGDDPLHGDEAGCHQPA